MRYGEVLMCKSSAIVMMRLHECLPCTRACAVRPRPQARFSALMQTSHSLPFSKEKETYRNHLYPSRGIGLLAVY